MNSEAVRLLNDRMRMGPSESSVPLSLPVLFFGNVFVARAATVGLNPSDKEYLDSAGLELDGATRRFQTLRSLAAPNRQALSDDQCAVAIDTMRDYFLAGKPIYSWFRHMDRVTRGMGLSYGNGEVAHLDLVQEATKPTWSALAKSSPEEFCKLRERDLPFLKWELEAFPFEYVICNGRTVYDEVCRLIGFSEIGRGRLQRVDWRAGVARIQDRQVKVVGWNIPLTRPTGLGAEGEIELGRTLLSSCSG